MGIGGGSGIVIALVLVSAEVIEAVDGFVAVDGGLPFEGVFDGGVDPVDGFGDSIDHIRALS